MTTADAAGVEVSIGRLPGCSSALALTPGGVIVNSAANALPFVAAAAAGTSRHLLSQAASQQRRHPGYYGGAWAAFGPTRLDSGLLNGC